MIDALDRRGAGLAWTIALLVTIAWGALAFGAVYPWAYRPLMLAAAVCGVWGSLYAAGRIMWGLVGGIVVVLAAIFVQLVPLSAGWLQAVSPAAHAVLMQHDFAYSLRIASGLEVHRALSINPVQTETALSFLLALGLLLVGAAGALSRSGLRRLVAGLAILGALIALVGIVQKTTYSGRIYGFWMPYEGRHPFGPFVNRNHFAGWMLMALPLVMGLLLGLMTRVPRRRWTVRERLVWLSTSQGTQLILLTFALVAMGLSLVLTMSRSAIGAFAVAMLVTMAMVARRGRDRGARRPARLAYVSVLVALSIGWAGIDAVAARFAQTDSAPLNARVAIWDDTVVIARDFAWTGSGIGTFSTVHPFYQRALPGRTVRAAHSDWLQAAAEGGLLVGVPLLALLALLAREAWRRFAEHAAHGDFGVTYWSRVGACTGLVAIGTQELVEFSLQMPGNAVLFTLLWAIAVAPMPTTRLRRSPAG